MSVIWTGRAVTPAHLNPAGWWRWIVQWKSHLILMNRKKEHSESFILSFSLSVILLVWALAHRTAILPKDRLQSLQIHIVIRCLRLVYMVIYRHMTAGYILVGVRSVKLDDLEASCPLFTSTKDNWLVWSIWTHMHTHTHGRSSSTNPDRHANSESIVYANVNVKRVKSRDFQAGYNHTYCCFVLV